MYINNMYIIKHNLQRDFFLAAPVVTVMVALVVVVVFDTSALVPFSCAAGTVAVSGRAAGGIRSYLRGITVAERLKPNRFWWAHTLLFSYSDSSTIFLVTIL